MASFNLWIEVKKRQHLGRENTDDDAVFSSNACVRKASTSSDQSSETHPQLLGGLPAAQRTSETPALEEQPLVRFLLQEHENPRTGEEKHVKGPNGDFRLVSKPWPKGQIQPTTSFLQPQAENCLYR